jgi:TatD DNase family protein
MTNIKIIDTHCHLYTNNNLEDTIDDIINRATESGISKIFMPNVDAATIEKMIYLEERYKHCYAMMGLHPCHVDEHYKVSLKLLEEWFAKRDFVGVGETGVDLYWDKTFVDEQIIAFNHQIDMSKELNRPIIIHSRECQDLTIELVEKKQDGRATGIFHCFGGTVEQMKKIRDLGFYIGIGGVVTYKKVDVAEVIKEVGLANVVLETDSPYLAPVPKRGKENEPSYLIYILHKIAESTSISVEEVARITTENALRVFHTVV